MKIAILTELFAPSVGGQQARYAELSKILTSRGHSVYVYCIQSVPGTKQVELRDGTIIYRRPEAYRYEKPLLKAFRRTPSAVLKYALWCRSINPDDFDCFIFNQWPIAHILLSPDSVRSKAVIDWCEYRNSTLFSLLQKYLPRLAARNMANSIALRSALEAQSGCKVEVLPSGIFSNQYRTIPPAERTGILSLGRIEEHKNLSLTLSAHESLRSKGYTGRLSIAGTGPEFNKLQQMVAASEAAASIDVLGSITEEQKIDLLATSEVLLLTSRREGFPRVIAEAMASGLPVVTVDFPGNGAKDVVYQHGVGKVTDRDPQQVAAGILAVMAEWESYSNAGISAAKNLDWEVLIERLLQIAENLPGTLI